MDNKHTECVATRWPRDANEIEFRKQHDNDHHTMTFRAFVSEMLLHPSFKTIYNEIAFIVYVLLGMSKIKTMP